MGEDKPSHLLKNMKDLAGKAFTDDAFKQLWIQRLPENVRAVISIAEGDSTQWAKQADKMMEINNFASVSAISTPLQDKIAALRKTISDLKAERLSRDSQKSNNRDEREQSRKSKEYKFCRYHHRFGSAVRKCTQPCQFNGKTEKSTEN